MKLVILGICLLSIGATVQALEQSCSMDFCDSCTDVLPQCGVCPSGYTRTDDLISCVECPDNCASCTAATEDDIVCTECVSSHFLENDRCENECDANCLNCSSATVCGRCASGYRLEEGQCEKCGTNCKTCTADACTSCDDDAYLQTGSCISCPANAASCRLVDTDVVVSSCDEGYEVNEDADACLPCPSECASCTSEDNGGNAACDSCNDEYYLDGEDCSSCVAECKDCEDGDNCEECNEGYALTPDDISTCQSCSTSQCKSCSINAGGETCSACNEGYRLNDAGNCESCQVSNCAVCDTAVDACDTDGCKDGYDDQTGAEVDGANPPLCLQIPDECKTLNPAANSDTAECATCEDGYYLDATPACTSCIDNCKTCTDGTTCDTCESGYDAQTIDAGGTVECLALPSNCATLNPTAADSAAVCESCDSGYLLNALTGVCDRCDDSNCGTCDPVETCSACKEGYYDTSDCTACESSCLTCTDGTTCDTCENGFGLNPTTGTCAECAERCVACDEDSTQCTQCLSEVLDYDGIIFDVLVDGVCYQCPDNCETCNLVDGRTECTDCFETFTPNEEGECVACPMNCNECVFVDDELSCGTCADTYGTNTHVCPACSSNCKVCSYEANVGVVCDECEARYYVEDDVCVACTSECLTCDSSGKCSECATGYGLNFNKTACVVCSELTGLDDCVTCGDYPDYAVDSAPCYSCTTGKYLVNGVGNGTEASCADDPDNLNCNGAGVLDMPHTCDANSCDPGFHHYMGECVVLCFRCGDTRIGSYVDADTCIRTNSTGAQFDYCPVNECIVRNITIDGRTQTMAGCNINRDTCSNQCQDVNGDSVEADEEGYVTCESCCTGTLCNYNSGMAVQGSVLLVLLLAIISFN